MIRLNPDTALSLGDGERITGLNFADKAEKVMRGGGDFSVRQEKLTTSSLRGVYGLIMNIYTDIGDEGEFEERRADIQYLKVKLAYEAGRKAPVKKFIEETGLKDALDDVEDYDGFMLYCRYAESLVAYFKFFGGKEW